MANLATSLEIANIHKIFFLLFILLKEKLIFLDSINFLSQIVFSGNF